MTDAQFVDTLKDIEAKDKRACKARDRAQINRLLQTHNFSILSKISNQKKNVLVKTEIELKLVLRRNPPTNPILTLVVDMLIIIRGKGVEA